MKMIVETTGEFQFIEPQTRTLICHNRPTLTKNTPFVNMKAGEGSITILAQGIPDVASDEDFLEYINEAEGDVELAVKSFCSQFEKADIEVLLEDGKEEANTKKKPAPKKTEPKTTPPAEDNKDGGEGDKS